MKKSENYFFGFGFLYSDVVRYRLLYGKASKRTGLKGSENHMTIFFDMGSLCLSEGSTGHFWPKSEF